MRDEMQRSSYVYFARVEYSSTWKLGASVDPARLTRHRIDKRRKDWYHLTCEEIETVLEELRERGPDILRRVKRLTEERRAAVKEARWVLSSPSSVLGGAL